MSNSGVAKLPQRNYKMATKRWIQLPLPGHVRQRSPDGDVRVSHRSKLDERVRQALRELDQEDESEPEGQDEGP